MRVEGCRSAQKILGRRIAATAACLFSLLLAACSGPYLRNAQYGPEPIVGPLTATAPTLENLPAPRRPITVAVYDFPDLTGQRRPGGVVADLSTAITQGASSLVIEALKSAGHGRWFDVVDRTRDADQARERSIRAEAEKGEKTTDIVPLRPADYILNGGVITFERSVLTSNETADWLGLGGGGNTNRNFVSVTMRLVKAQTAEVVESVTVHKSIDSVAAGIFSHNRAAPFGQYPNLLLLKYPSLSDALDADFSGTVAELTEVALREAIETAITDLIIRCEADKIWKTPVVAAHIAHDSAVPRGKAHLTKAAVPGNPQREAAGAAAETAGSGGMEAFDIRGIEAADSKGAEAADKIVDGDKGVAAVDGKVSEAADVSDHTGPASFAARYDDEFTPRWLADIAVEQ